MTDELSTEAHSLAAHFEIQASFCDGTVLHRKDTSKTLSTPIHCSWPVLLLQIQKEQLTHPLERDGCLGNILPVSHHEEGRQTGEVQGNCAAVQSQRQEGLHNPACFFPSLPALSAHD